MPRVQAIIVRGNRILMVKHQQGTQTWWCLPGGGQEPGESSEEGVLRELREECNVDGVIVKQTSYMTYTSNHTAISYLVDIGDQTPRLGFDPEAATGTQAHSLVDVQWLRLLDIPERDRAFLWAAGLLGVPNFFMEVERWGDATSYPGDEGEPVASS